MNHETGHLSLTEQKVALFIISLAVYFDFKAGYSKLQHPTMNDSLSKKEIISSHGSDVLEDKGGTRKVNQTGRKSQLTN